MSSPLVYTLPLFMFSDSHTRESDFWIILTNFYVSHLVLNNLSEAKLFTTMIKKFNLFNQMFPVPFASIVMFFFMHIIT